MKSTLSASLSLSVLGSLSLSSLLHAHDPLPSLPSSSVVGKADNLLEQATSASSGEASNEELSQRPTLRRGELLEVVPGVIVTQHAGGGKANQYFVRGFNLDHGTDFNVSLDGMPLNYRNHAHGQGYADINFIVPEFVDHLHYFKGPQHSQFGDLSSAGGASYHLHDVLPQCMLSLTYGSYDYKRLLLADSWKLGNGFLSAGMEYEHSNGPWFRGDDYHRYNFFSRYYQGTEDNYWNVTLLGHQGKWNSSDQIPLRAIENGTLDRFGSVDPTTGGNTSRYSLSTQWHREEGNTTTHLDAWVGYYDLELYSNFTYFLNDPVRGDQFEQSESRIFSGFNLYRSYQYEMSGKQHKTTIGLQNQNDFINDIGLYLTEDRQRYSTVRHDDVITNSFSLYLDHETRINSWLRAGLGLRGDFFHFDVDSDLAANSGTENDFIASPKLRLIFGPWQETEFYLNAGLGFHSNDARGVTIKLDPTDGVTPVDSADPLVRTKGAEIGVRSHAIKNLTTTASLWFLKSDSELVYVGDAGTSEAGDASKRFGLELASYYRPNDWLTIDAEYSWSHARFTGVAAGQNHIPNSIDHMASAGLTIGKDRGYFGSLRARYFAPRPLEESDSVKSDPSFLLNARVGYRSDNWEASIDVLNLLDSSDNDIEYYYESRLSTEAIGIEGKHIHPAEPRQLRVNFTYKF